MVEIQYQSARLSQVLVAGYESQSTAVRALTSDVLRLASASGQSAQSAMESAIQWARLGLSRVEVAEAVRVSLQAANVAEISAGQATERLSAITASYGLRVGELAGTLGVLNDVSNRFNVTTSQMFDALVRTASVARQAGMPLAELIATLGAAIGTSGQTGAVLGTAMKSITGKLNSPKVQEQLREAYAIEITTDGGEVKDLPEALARIYEEYTRLSDASRKSLVFDVGGLHQASKLASMLDSYTRAQVLAISAQRNLSSAQGENEKIVETLKSKLAGLVTEFERLAYAQSRGPFDVGPAKALGAVVDTLRNSLELLNTSVGGTALSGFLVLLSVVGAKLAVTGLQLKTVGQAGGFVGRSFAEVRAAMTSLATVANVSIQRFVSSGKALTKTGATVRIAVDSLNEFANASSIAAARSGKMATGFRAASVAAKALAISVAAIWQHALPLLGVTVAMWGFNRAMEAGRNASEAADRKLAGFNDRAEQMASSARSAAQAMRFLDTVSRSFPTARKDSQDKQIEAISEIASIGPDGSKDDEKAQALENELRTLRDQGDTVAVLARFDQIRRDIAMEGMLFRHEELQLLERQNEAIREQIDEANRAGKTKLVTELESKLIENREARAQKLVSNASEAEEDRKGFLDRDQRQLNFLERQKLALQSISELYADLPGATHTDRLNSEAAAVAAQIKFSETAMAALKNDPGVATAAADERAKATANIRDEIQEARKLQAELDSEFASMPKSSRTAFEKHRERNAQRGEFAEELKKSGAGNILAGVPEFLGAEPTTSFAEENSLFGKALDAKLTADVATLEDLQAKRDAVRTRLSELFRKVDATRKDATAPEIRNEAQVTEIESTLSDLRSREAALNDANTRAIAEQRDRRALALQFAKVEADSFAVGDGPGEQRVAKIRSLERSVQEKESQADSSPDSITADNLRVQALEHRVQLTDELIRGELRLLEISRDELTVLQQKGKEYQRSILTAGPSEMLRKIALDQLTKSSGGRLNAGAFFALDGAARQELLSRPENSDEVRGLQRERLDLRRGGFGQSNLLDVQRMNAATAASRGQSQRQLGFDSLGISEGAARVVAGFTSLNAATASLVSSFHAAVARFNNFAPAGGVATPQAPRRGSVS